MKQRLIFATGNEHKMKEIREILDESKYEIISMKEAFDRLDTWSKYVITSYEDTEKYLGKPTKKRKVYNGMIRGEFYQYLGPKPPRRRK